MTLLQSRRQARKLGYWGKLCSAESERLLSVVFRRRHAEVVAGTAPQSCLVAFQEVLMEHGFTEQWAACDITDGPPVILRTRGVVTFVALQRRKQTKGKQPRWRRALLW